MKDFWQKWEEADDVTKLKLVKTLPIFDGWDKVNLNCPMFTPTVVNSYFVDLYTYCKGKG